MSQFQKIILGLLSICVLSIGYYFVFALPEHDALVAELRQKELKLKEDQHKTEQTILEIEKQKQIDENKKTQKEAQDKINEQKNSTSAQQVKDSDIKEGSIQINNDTFSKRKDCIKYETSVYEANPGSLISVFYSPSKNTCISKVITIATKSAILSDILGDDVYAVSSDGQMVYDHGEFGENQTIVSIEERLRGE